MALTYEEREGSPSIRIGSTKAVEEVTRSYYVEDTNEPSDPTDFTDSIDANISDTYLGLPLLNIDTQWRGAELRWVVEATYGVRTFGDDSLGTSVTNFDASASTVNVKQSLQVVSTHTPDAQQPAPDFQGSINVEGDRVNGVDIIVPTFTFTVQEYLTTAQVSDAYIRAVGLATGSMNSHQFRNYEAGELLFMGASGTERRAKGDWVINFKFGFSPNQQDIEVGPDMSIDKFGWDYLSVYYDADTDGTANALIQKPTAAYVHRVYPSINFTTVLGIT